MTLQTASLWFYSAMASLVFGAAVYEAIVVHPAWSRKPPESFVAFMGTPLGRMNIAGFWIPVAPLFALSALASVGAAGMEGTLNRMLLASAACGVTAVAWTLIYFRPTVTRFLEQQGGDAPAERLQAEARRWIVLNWIRVVLIVVSWVGVLAAFHS
jgi:Domain of unknown function (DUF1772)